MDTSKIENNSLFKLKDKNIDFIVDYHTDFKLEGIRERLIEKKTGLFKFEVDEKISVLSKIVESEISFEIQENDYNENKEITYSIVSNKYKKMISLRRSILLKYLCDRIQVEVFIFITPCGNGYNLIEYLNQFFIIDLIQNIGTFYNSKSAVSNNYIKLLDNQIANQKLTNYEILLKKVQPCFSIKNIIKKTNNSIISLGIIENNKCAIKSVNLDNLDKKNQHSFLNEIFIIKKLTNVVISKNISPSPICQYFDQINCGNTLHLFMSFSDGSILDLITFIKSGKRSYFSYLELKFIVENTLEALDIMHSLNIVHRDIKSSNIFYKLGNDNKIISVQLGDFGLSKSLSSSGITSKCVGSSRWMAPEVYKNNYGIQADIWSFGMFILELLTCEYPYEGINILDVPKTIKDRIFPQMNWLNDNNNNCFKDIIYLCIDFNPENRPSTKKLIEMLKNF